MRALLLALLLTSLPTAALADDGGLNRHEAERLCGCRVPPEAQLTWLGPQFGLWWVDYSGTFPTAINPSTGQIAFVIVGQNASLTTYPGGGGFIITTPTQQPYAVWLASLPPAPPIALNLYQPPSTVVTGPTQPSRYQPAPLVPNLWSPGQPLPDGPGRDSNGPQTAPAAPTAPDHDAGQSPHQ